MREGGRGTDIIVIGAGLSGLTAAVHAVQAGARVRLIAQGWGQQIVTPGWISVCDRAEDDVIAEVRGYAALHPHHPYALAGADGMLDCLDRFQAMMAAIGLPYDRRRSDGHNLRLMTMLGALQTPMLAPRGLANGDLTDVLEPVLVVGFAGWRDFHPRLATENLVMQGIPARPLSIPLPGESQSWDRWPGDLAHQFDHAVFRETVIKAVKPQVRGAAKIGFPAVLGLDKHAEALADLAEALGRPVFEIATLPPSVPGTRLGNRLRRWLLRQGARVQIGHPVVGAIVENGRCLGVEVGALGHPTRFDAEHVILATGGLYNGGIQSDLSGRLWEPIFGLPVHGPDGDGRAGWFDDELLGQRGHAIHRATGLRVNAQMQPVDAEGAPVLENVYAVGHLLAGFNPLTDGCAEGIALATALKAVQAMAGNES